MKTKNMTTLHLRKSIGRSPLRLAFLLIPLVLTCFALSPTAQAQLPPPAPDGGYPNGNTAEGDGALFNLTTGIDNTATGFDALQSNTIGDSNTANGWQALMNNTTINGVSGIRNTAVGYAALANNTIGDRNTATGRAALPNNTTGFRNTADGQDALFNNLTGDSNTATGDFALFSNTTGVANTGIGRNALLNSTGGQNTALGFEAGQNLTTGSNNIDIGNAGVATESNTIRIGAQGTQTKTFMAGINGAGVTGVAVKVNAAGQLGTAPSSERFKDAIKPMDKASEAILALKPVTFHYKKELDPEGTPQFGLVAEQVEKVNPDLVARDDQGKVYTVRYEAVNAMLLNEFLKEHRKVEQQVHKMQEQEATIAQLKSIVAQQQKEFQTTAAHQQKEIETLTAGLQKVSAQLELNKPAPQTVLNDQ
jgi:hypothetical protein